jgi:2-dehydropantoate 2-reductase
MRILILGAGAIGGYFGARLLEAGRDVTFFVRPTRAAQLARGLSVRSTLGDVDLPPPPTVVAEVLQKFDLVLLSCKAYDLDGAMDAVAPAIGPDTKILPLLNGMGHMERLAMRFGAEKVFGGLCMISATLGPDGEVEHFGELARLLFGEQSGARSGAIDAIARAFAGAKFDAQPSDAILHDMWEKWIFIATGAGITCLMRATVGDIVAAGADDLVAALLDECAAIATRNGFPPGEQALLRTRTTFTEAGSSLKASMLRDIERGGRTEGDHIFGDLLRRGSDVAGTRSLLRIAHAHVQAYEARHRRGG